MRNFDPNEKLRDDLNNAAGVTCKGNDVLSCTKCCWKKLWRGRLALNAWQRFETAYPEKGRATGGGAGPGGSPQGGSRAGGTTGGGKVPVGQPILGFRPKYEPGDPVGVEYRAVIAMLPVSPYYDHGSPFEDWRREFAGELLSELPLLRDLMRSVGSRR